MGEPSLPLSQATVGRPPTAASLRRTRRQRRIAVVSVLTRLDAAAADLIAATLEGATATRRRATASALGAPP
eukprot:7528124-Alexandrium_andersonii.AAC.1